MNSPWLRRDLETRKEKREDAWQLDGWAGTVNKARLLVSIHYSD